VVLVAVVLALVAAAMHGTWNVLVKTSADPLMTFYRSTVAAAAIFTVPTLIACILLRPCTSRFGEGDGGNGLVQSQRRQVERGLIQVRIKRPIVFRAKARQL
jgi:hypothetical protein